MAKLRLFDQMMLSTHVDAVKQIAPRWRHITLTGPALAGLAWTPGNHIRLQVGADTGAVDWLIGALRTYTVWDYDGERLELVAYDHGDSAGPGAEWARKVRPGHELRLLKPQGSFTTSAADYHLFAGEETAQASFGPMLRALPDGARVFVRVEVDSPDERLDLGQDWHPDWDLAWTYRNGREAASSQTLVDAVRSLDLPVEPGLAYLAGEARTIQMVRRHLVEERGWPRRSVRTKPYWTPGRRGMD